MDSQTIVAIASIITSGITIAIGTMMPAIGEGMALSKALEAIAQQPDSSNIITRNLFVGLAMIESLAIYCLVIAIILIFTNPFWNFMITHLGK